MLPRIPTVPRAVILRSGSGTLADAHKILLVLMSGRRSNEHEITASADATNPGGVAPHGAAGPAPLPRGHAGLLDIKFGHTAVDSEAQRVKSDVSPT
ncbi:hypothetical protein D9V29_04595 [Mycetocola manganoxydans]|uniref:Uncharacterized protein n=1 Tax=Mycetocola manganoxydans TaxID=699879 RepID=A0A3L6ZXD3_9MICO|nr:hypothetical protein D9V29_04595 [Mycetocola manganoxydans]GHD40345.1 hypothetical protein GCM10008097_04390 [Mycetocola manganoxydans]